MATRKVREKNPCGKMRNVDNPYETYTTANNLWTWRVLKKYQAPSKEKANQLARWFVAVKSPHTHGSWELGDEYAKNVIDSAKFITIHPTEVVNSTIVGEKGNGYFKVDPNKSTILD